MWNIEGGVCEKIIKYEVGEYTKMVVTKEKNRRVRGKERSCDIRKNVNCGVKQEGKV